MAIEFPMRAGAAGGAGARPRRKKVPGARKIRLKELPMFTRMVAAMLDSGIPLVQTLGALEEQTENKADGSREVPIFPPPCWNTPMYSICCTSAWSAPGRRAGCSRKS